jgi:hypothetical protein
MVAAAILLVDNDPDNCASLSNLIPLVEEVVRTP